MKPTQPTLQTLIDTLRDRGHAQYGSEAVSQLDHALHAPPWQSSTAVVPR